MVSAVAIVISQATILICAWVFGLSGIVANTIGAVVATPASYELNRKWAWRKGGKSHLWREVVPFWALTFVGWLASTGTVEIADSLCQSHGVTGLARAVAIMGASLFAYGVVWIGKFFLFNRLIFATDQHRLPPLMVWPGLPSPVRSAASGPTVAVRPRQSPVPTTPAFRGNTGAGL